MFLQGSGSVSGTVEELALMLRCRTSQMQLALAEMKKFSIADVNEQNRTNDEQNVVFTITCRRNLRTVAIKKLRIDAGRASGASRRTKCEQTPTSTYTSTSLRGKEECEKEGDFKAAMATVPIFLSERIAGHLDFAEMVFESWNGRDGRDGSGVSVRFAPYLKKRWNEEGEQWRNHCHPKQKANGKAAKLWMEKTLTPEEEARIQAAKDLRDRRILAP